MRQAGRLDRFRVGGIEFGVNRVNFGCRGGSYGSLCESYQGCSVASRRSSAYVCRELRW